MSCLANSRNKAIAEAVAHGRAGSFLYNIYTLKTWVSYKIYNNNVWDNHYWT